jgi:hypothetical protein
MASSEDEFEDAVDSLESLPNRARVFSPNGLHNEQTPTTSRVCVHVNKCKPFLLQADDNPRRRLSGIKMFLEISSKVGVYKLVFVHKKLRKKF